MHGELLVEGIAGVERRGKVGQLGMPRKKCLLDGRRGRIKAFDAAGDLVLAGGAGEEGGAPGDVGNGIGPHPVARGGHELSLGENEGPVLRRNSLEDASEDRADVRKVGAHGL